MILDRCIPSGSSVFIVDHNNGQNVDDCVLVIITLCVKKRPTFESL